MLAPSLNVKPIDRTLSGVTIPGQVHSGPEWEHLIRVLFMGQIDINHGFKC